MMKEASYRCRKERNNSINSIKPNKYETSEHYTNAVFNSKFY